VAVGEVEAMHIVLVLLEELAAMERFFCYMIIRLRAEVPYVDLEE
jgi:hypothetical protein